MARRDYAAEYSPVTQTLFTKKFLCRWYARLHNGSKNFYFAKYPSSKGSVAEDLRNSELSYPRVVGLILEKANGAAVVEQVLKTWTDTKSDKALDLIRTPAGIRETMSNDQTTSVSRSIKRSTGEDMSCSETHPAKKDAQCTTTDIPAEDLAYWKQRCVPIVQSLLQSCGAYSPTDQAAQLQFLQENVIPNLGPRPADPQSQVISMATLGGFPLQPSINISSSGSTKLRYTFEPLDNQSGTSKDPFALGPAQRELFKVANQLGVWKGWIEHLASAYHPTAEQVEEMRPRIRQYFQDDLLRRTNGQSHVIDLPEIRRMWVCFIAFDLVGPGQAMKAYFDPKVKEIATGIPSCKYCYQVLRTMTRFGNTTAVDMLEEFLTEVESVGAVELIAIDCVPENKLPSARIKVYVHTMTNSFKTVREWVTMGGRLNDSATVEQLARLREIWHLLLGEPNGLPDEGFNKPLSGFSPAQHHLYFSYEMKAGNSKPVVKVYTPVQNYAANDDEVIRNYEANFRQCRWPLGEDGSYRRIIESAFGHAKHERNSFLHGGSSFIYSEGKGIYQSIYLDPPLDV